MSYTKSFIEKQFPVSKISKESYKERMANNGQTLTVLGKWWGRKPLILVRSIILGLLMPASNTPKKDRAIFLKILTMDNEGLWLRKEKNPLIEDFYKLADNNEKTKFFTEEIKPDGTKKLSWNNTITADQKAALQKILFEHMGYDERLKYCVRPEHVKNLPLSEWNIINSHLGTTATSLQELVVQLGKEQFGHIPRIGDAFCGGGSIPFEAARMGCEVIGSDLNPVAALLTWAALNIIGGGEDVVKEVRAAQENVYKSVDKQITEWGIEHNEQGWRADAYLYCVEAVCPITRYKIPLAPSWVIGEKTKAVAKLVRNDSTKAYDIEIHSGVSEVEMKRAKESGSIQDGYMVNPGDSNTRTSIQVLRGDRTVNRENIFGLRMWENEDVVPKEDDVFGERLYCIRYIETYYEKWIMRNKKKEWIDFKKEEAEILPDYSVLLKQGVLRKKTRKHYVAPNKVDLEREAKVLRLLKERFQEWQKKGYIPSSVIERGEKTDEPIRTRGWTYWHHLFNPRQLLTLGCFSCLIDTITKREAKIGCLLGLNILTQYNSRLSRYRTEVGNEARTESVYYNQALNTLYNYGCRPTIRLRDAFYLDVPQIKINDQNKVNTCDARINGFVSDYWITDPPYADAINYHELNDFFLAWYEKFISKLFFDWYVDSKKALAIKGDKEDFRKGTIEAYSNLCRHMPDNGAQVVMFTHQSASVWADLALILWASGLQVSAAWTIATETNSALKAGNYVQGTVCMILRKQTTKEETFINDIYPEVEHQVTGQLKAMLALEDKEDRNFSDSDYQLAAYAAALRVLTSYRKIHPIDVQYELTKSRKKGEKNEVEKLIDKAVIIATNYLIPEGFDKDLWITLRPEEKFYLKGLEVETHEEFRSGVYQEFARGFGVKEYKNMLSTGKANETRLRSAIEFKNKNLRDDGFGTSVLRQILFAIHETNLHEDPNIGKQFLKDEIKDYWQNRQRLIALARYIQNLGSRIEHWKDDAKAANLLAGSLENDHL
jgi:putative DNA methylase